MDALTRWRGFGLFSMLLATLSFSLLFSAAKVAGSELSVFEIMLWRGLIATPIIVLMVRRRGFYVHAKGFMLARVVFGFAAMASYFFAVRSLNMADFSMISRLQPLLVAIVAPWVLGASEKPSARIWIALGLGLLGVAVIAGPDLQVGNIGGLMAMVGALCAAFGHVMLRALGRTDHPTVVVFWFQLGLIPLGFLLQVLTTGALPHWPSMAVMPALLLAGVMAVAGQFFLTLAYRYEKVTVAATAAYAGPIWAMLIDLGYFGVAPHLGFWLGGPLVVAAGGVLIAEARKETPQPSSVSQLKLGLSRDWGDNSCMAHKKKTRCIGILTSGGDCPGLNAAIRAIAKPAMDEFDMKVIGILDGFRGLVENRSIALDNLAVSGILTQGGTILGTSRDKPHKMLMGGKLVDMVDAAVENARKLQIDTLVCLGGGGTQKNAMRLLERGGLDVMTLPKTIDNDVAMTDVTFGYDTAKSIATDAIDRLHTTATSHHRVIVCEVMGHSAGWLALGAGIAGGADVILIPEIPYDPQVVANYVLDRRRHGKRFSIIAVAEGAISKAQAEEQRVDDKKKTEKKALKKAERRRQRGSVEGVPLTHTEDGELVRLVKEPRASSIAREIQELSGAEVRVTSLGHVQRGGAPTPADRVLCTRLGTTAAQLLADGVRNVLVAVHKGKCVPVPLEQVAGKRRIVPLDHEMVRAARLVGTCLGDE